MPQYFFILGRESELCSAEINAKLKEQNIAYTQIAKTDSFLILQTTTPLDCQSLMQELSGTIKIGEIQKEEAKISPTSLLKYIPKSDKKICFGISCYDFNCTIEKFGRDMKAILKKEGRSVRFVSSKQYPLSSVIVQKEILSKGVEIVILKIENKFLVGTTQEVQPFEKFSEFDFGRPARDSYSGMLPPKLAQIMINLSEAKKNVVIYDPFCGSGTVLFQAAMLGFTNLIGSDISEKQIADTQNNLNWLKEKTNLDFKAELFVLDVKDVPAKLKTKIDFIVSEPYLGKPLKGNETEKEIFDNIENLKKFYATALSSLEKILNANATMIIIAPEIVWRGKTFTLGINRLLPKNLTIENTWQYARADQHIIRRIYKLRKI